MLLSQGDGVKSASEKGFAPSRRTVVAGVAWAAPAVVLSAASPAWATSDHLDELFLTASKPALVAGESTTLLAGLLRDRRGWADQIIEYTVTGLPGASLSRSSGPTDATGTCVALLYTPPGVAGTAVVTARAKGGLLEARVALPVTVPARTASGFVVPVGDAWTHHFYGMSGDLRKVVKTAVQYDAYTYSADGTELYASANDRSTLYVLDGDSLAVKRTVPLTLGGAVFSDLQGVRWAWSLTRDERILFAANGSNGATPGFFFIDPRSGRMEHAGFAGNPTGQFAACQIDDGRYLKFDEVRTDTFSISFTGPGGGAASPGTRIRVMTGASLQRLGRETYFINRGRIERVDIAGSAVTFSEVGRTEAYNYWRGGAVR